MLRSIFVPACLLLFATTSQAQVLQWAMQTEGMLTGRGRTDLYHLTEDGAGNLYVAGVLNGALDLDMSDAGVTEVVESTGGNSALFVAKYAADGTLQWALPIGTEAGDDYTSITIADVAADAAGNVVLVGQYEASGAGFDIDPGPGSQVVSGPASDTGFIARIDPDGNLTWVVSLIAINSVNGGPSARNHPVNGVAFDASGKVYVTGRLDGAEIGGISFSIDMDPLGSGQSLAVAGSFVARYDAGGTLDWVRTFVNEEGSIGSIIGDKVAVNADGNVFASGTASGIVSFGADLTRDAGQIDPDAYLVKLDAEGTTEWVVTLDNDIPQDSQMESLALTATSDGDVLFAGRFDASVDFDPGPGEVRLTSFVAPGNVDDQDAFVARYDGSGNLMWVNRIGGGISSEFVCCLAESAQGSVFASGTYQIAAQFDPAGPVIDGSTEFFLVEYDGQGGGFEAVYESSTATPTTSSGSANDGYGMVVTGGSTMVLMGTVSADSLDVDFGPGVTRVGVDQTLSGDDRTDALFVARYDLSSRPTGIERPLELPRTLTVGQAYPNPFRGSVAIPFSLAASGRVSVSVYDVLGREVVRLADAALMPAGAHSIDWQADGLPAGVYFSRIEAGGVVQTGTLIRQR